MEYIEIDKDLIPYEFIIELDNDEYKLDVRYNETYDFFTVDLYKDEYFSRLPNLSDSFLEER